MRKKIKGSESQNLGPLDPCKPDIRGESGGREPQQPSQARLAVRNQPFRSASPRMRRICLILCAVFERLRFNLPFS